MIEQDSQYKDQYIPVGAVRGLGDQRNNFEKWCDQEYGENNWEMVHVLEIHGEEVYLTNQEFFEHIYVPAMFNWINQNFPFMPSLLLEVASSVYEYAPEDALPFIRYDENGHAEFDTDQTDMPLGFPGQAIAVTLSLLRSIENAQFKGDKDYCIGDSESGDVVPEHPGVDPNTLIGVPFGTLISPVIVALEPEVGIPSWVGSLELINQQYQQYSGQYYENWRHETATNAENLGLEHLIGHGSLTIEKGYQSSRVLMVRDGE